MLDFVERNKGIEIQSTGATVVNYVPGLYNVSGSTEDPAAVPGHMGRSWKRLLIEKGISDTSECYATGPLANDGSSHPKFSVGGHMTPNADGSVSNGLSYLMPLCSWHNSTSNNGKLFSHTHTSMLKLTGYMQGELAVTFQLRLPSADPYALLFYSEGGWEYRNLSDEQAANIASESLMKSMKGPEENYVLFKREQGNMTLHYIEAVNLPG